MLTSLEFVVFLCAFPAPEKDPRRQLCRLCCGQDIVCIDWRMKGLNLALLAFIAWRIASVFLVRTFYVPDEYWQGVEVAHKITFG